MAKNIMTNNGEYSYSKLLGALSYFPKEISFLGEKTIRSLFFSEHSKNPWK